MVADLHSHILPGIDDGSSSVEESLEMLRRQKAQNVDLVLATPHFYSHADHPDAFLERRQQALAQVLRAAGDENLPRLQLGAEVYYFPGMSDSDALQKLAIQGSSFILVEMPMAKWSDRMYRELLQIRQKQELTPIVAHIDRYLNTLNAGSVLRRLEELPVLVQANASFFLHRSSSRMAMRMLKNRQIHLLGSDCHDLDSRPPQLGQAVALIEKKLGAAALEEVEYFQSQVLGE